MSARYPAGVVRKNQVVPAANGASGVWTIGQATQAVKSDIWPYSNIAVPIQNSLRFRGTTNYPYLSRSAYPTSSGTSYTLSFWLKFGGLPSASFQDLFCFVNTGASRQAGIGFSNAGTGALTWWEYTGSYTIQKITSQLFRDPSAWYHIVCTWDSANATAEDRARIYVNGVRVTSFSTNTNPAQNTVTQFSNGSLYPYIGAQNRNNSYGYYHHDGYMADVNFIDSQSLTPSSFGQTSAVTGVWEPKPYTGSYGTNGFHLEFKDTNVGKDTSGNNNHWTPNNFSTTLDSTYDLMTDVPTQWAPRNTTDVGGVVRGNYCTFNPLAVTSVAATFADGNLKVTTGLAGGNGYGTMAIPESGKWYWEITAGSGNNPMIGISAYLSTQVYAWSNGNSVFYYVNGQKYVDGTGSAYGASYTTNDVIGVAVDADAGTITFYKNNTSQGSITHAVIGLFPCVADGASATADIFNANFGQRPFAYTPPSGYKPLCTTNLPTPTIGATVATAANKYFDATTYTGTGASLSVTNAGSFQPDFVWFKNRSNAQNNHLMDVNRGGGDILYSNLTNAEDVLGTSWANFTSTGFSIGAGSGINNSGNTFVAWQWKAGGTAVTNTSGSISAQVSANTTTGFSVITYTGNGTLNATIGHGLGVAPSMVIIKNRVGTNNWDIYHISNGAQKYMDFTTAAVGSLSTIFPTTPTSSVVYLGTTGGQGTNGTNYLAYCWSEIAGFSKFGSYTGNGSTDGPFIYTGFRPKFVMVKCSTAVEGWYMWDTSRDTYNSTKLILQAHASTAELGTSVDTYAIDILSNGFKLKQANVGNQSGQTMIYMAFAENPFKNALAR